MKAATMQGPPPDPVRHSWMCTRSVELVRRRRGGKTLNVCLECGGDDRDDGPEAA